MEFHENLDPMNCNEIPIECQCNYNGISVNIDGVPITFVWNFNGIPMEHQWNANGNPMELEWNINGICMEFQQDSNGI